MIHGKTKDQRINCKNILTSSASSASGSTTLLLFVAEVTVVVGAAGVVVLDLNISDVALAALTGLVS